MKKTNSKTRGAAYKCAAAIAFLTIILMGQTMCGSTSETKENYFKVGFAEIDVTPPVGTIMGGYGAPGGARRSEGTHDPLMAMAAFFTNSEGQSFVIISLDTVGYLYDFGDWGPGIKALRQNIVEKLKNKIALEPEHILIASEHTHASTDLIGFWQKTTEGENGVNKELLQTTLEQITSAAVAAFEAQKKAVVYFGQTELAGYTGRNMDCSPVVDNAVNFIHVKDEAGIPIVTIVNYGKHPTTLPMENHLMSADFVWGYRDVMKKQTGAPAMFLQGFIAAVHDGPKSGETVALGSDGKEDAFQTAYNMGKILADKVLETLPNAEQTKSCDVMHKYKHFTCEAKGDYMVSVIELFNMPQRYIHKEGEGENVKYFVDELEASWHKLGDAEFALFPGEGTPEYSITLRSHMASKYKFVVGLANDSIGYLVDPESLAADTSGELEGYELKMGLGRPGGPAAFEAIQSLGWFDGGWKSEK